MQIRRKDGESTLALELTTRWFHFYILTSRSPSSNHANFVMKAPWAGFKPESSSKGTFFSSAGVTRFVNSPLLEESRKFKKSRPSFMLRRFAPQSNWKVSYLFISSPTCGNFLALPTKKLQEFSKKLIVYWKIGTVMPLQTIKTNLSWPQEVCKLLENL